MIHDIKLYSNIGKIYITLYNWQTKQITLFNQTYVNLINTDRFRRTYFNRCLNLSQIGNSQN